MFALNLTPKDNKSLVYPLINQNMFRLRGRLPIAYRVSVYRVKLPYEINMARTNNLTQ